MREHTVFADTHGAVDKWIGVVAGVVAPTTVITGLCYYFGFVSARAYFAYFGVDTESFQYSTTDYVLRSVSVLYPALVIALVPETPLGTQPGQRFTHRYECLRTLVVRPDRWVLVPARWTVENGYSVIIPIDDSSRVSPTKLDGLADNEEATKWESPWQCPEIAPL